MKDYKIGLTIFLILGIVITLYPPYLWDTKKFIDKDEHYEFLYRYNINTIDFPFKSYDFLFSNYKRIGWGWDSINKKSIHIDVPLERQVIIAELILEYLLAGFVASFVQATITLTKRKNL